MGRKLEKNVDKMNGTKSSMTDMKKRILLRKEIHEVDKKPCTKELFWSKKSSRSDRTLKVPENCGLYYFKWESE